MRRQRHRPLSEINVVPYIDVMLVLLVIFMITAPLLTQGVKVELPKEQAQIIQPPPIPPLIVSVDRKGQYFVNQNKKVNKALNAKELKQVVADKLNTSKQTKVYIKGDRRVSYGMMMHAMVLLQQAGAESVGLVTDTEVPNT